LFLAWLPAASQESGKGPERQAFERRLGGPGKEVGNTVIQLEDGGYAVVGYTDSEGAGGDDVYLVRTDAQGEIRWSKTYGGKGDDYGWDLREMPGGGFLIVGYTDSWGAGRVDVLLLRTDPEGTMIWRKTFGGDKIERAWAMTEASGGDFVLAAQTDSWGAGDWDAFILRVTSAGEMKWSRVQGGPGLERVFGVVATEDGGFAVAGMSKKLPDGFLDPYLIRVDSQGGVLWEKRYDGPEDDLAHSLLAIPGGGFLLTGYGRSFGAGGQDLYLMRVDDSGELLWKKEHGGPGNERGMMSTFAHGGGFMTIGYRETPSNGWDAFLMLTDSEGNRLWDQGAGGSGFDRGVMVSPTRDGGYIYTGTFVTGDGDPGILPLTKLFPKTPDGGP